ncbi:MAG: hypothetical protein BGO55_30505 [Sphingobacteriales bacterium 50-39]|nr:hypothetical protein [Sphingobacteriales bacterium]OJW60851.1 MAG: hypothetical protein BGO55_30505 [Sphingobacteriales bacterium 50-39]
MSHFYPYQQQQQQLFITFDLNNIGDYIVNFGYGIGLSDNTDRSIVKVTIGRKTHERSWF